MVFGLDAHLCRRPRKDVGLGSAARHGLLSSWLCYLVLLNIKYGTAYIRPSAAPTEAGLASTVPEARKNVPSNIARHPGGHRFSLHEHHILLRRLMQRSAIGNNPPRRCIWLPHRPRLDDNGSQGLIQATNRPSANRRPLLQIHRLLRPLRQRPPNQHIHRRRPAPEPRHRWRRLPNAVLGSRRGGRRRALRTTWLLRHQARRRAIVPRPDVEVAADWPRRFPRGAD